METNNGKKGGLLKGKPHYDKNGKSLGGIKAVVTDSNKQVELEGGEVIINKHASRKYWKELSRINQSAGGGVAISNPSGSDEDPEEYKDGGNVIDFNPNHIPNKLVLNYASKIKAQYPKVWDMGGNIFGNEAFNNLKRVADRGHWLHSEKWMYVKWRSFVARHKQDFRINGVIAMLKWVDKVDKGWSYMKDIIESEIEKKYEKKNIKPSILSKGGKITCKKCGWKWDKKDGGNDPYVCHKCHPVIKDKFENGGKIAELTKIGNEIYISKDKDKLPKDALILEHRYKDKIKAGELGFFATEIGENDEFFGDKIAYISIGANAKIKKLKSTYEFLKERNQLSIPNDYIINKYSKYGFKSYEDLFSDAGELDNPDDSYYEFQKKVVQDMLDEGEKFDIIEFAYEDDFTPHQYLITTLKNSDIKFQHGGRITDVYKSKSSIINTILEKTEPKLEELLDRYIVSLKYQEKKISDSELELIKLGLIMPLIKALGKYISNDDKLDSINVIAGKGGTIEIKSYVIRDGKTYKFYTNMIVASGAIQRAHYRYLVNTNLPTNSNNAAETEIKEKIKRLTKLESLNLDLQSYKNRLSEQIKKVEDFETKYSGKSDDEFYKIHINELKLKGKNDFEWPSWEEIVKRGADKNYNYDQKEYEEEILKSKIDTVKSKKYSNDLDKTWIKDVQKQIEKLEEKISELNPPKQKSKLSILLDLLQVERKEKGGNIKDLISKCIVELKMFKTKSTHAAEYGLDSVNPLYIQNLSILETKRLKGNGKKVLNYIDAYAVENKHDFVFGHIAQKATFTKDKKKTHSNDIDSIKKLLATNGYKINSINNDFYKSFDIAKDKKFEKGGLIAPNGNQSNLSAEQYALVRTKEFKAWFGDWENDPENASKVVDKNGEPLVVYHGSSHGGITSFNRNESERYGSGLKEYGDYFTTNIKLAKFYHEKTTLRAEKIKEIDLEIQKFKKLLLEIRNSTEYDKINNEIEKLESIKKGKIYPVFLNLRTIHEFDAKGKEEMNAWYELKVDAGYKIATNRDAMQFLKNAEFGVERVDGILAKNIIDAFIQGNEFLAKELIGDVYLVFDGNGNNVKMADGSNKTFDKNNPDIRFEQGGNVAANGKQSNLTAEQSKLVRNKEFKAWFGDWENDPENASKVVDENGEPLVVYHGTAEMFYEFQKEKQNIATGFGDFGAGFYFTASLDTAKYYTLKFSNRLVISVFMKIINPFILELNWERLSNNSIEKYRKLKGLYDWQKEIIKNALENDNDRPTKIITKGLGDYEFQDLLIRNGFDGVFVNRINIHQVKNVNFEDEILFLNEIVAFESNQIKIADGSNTTFDSNNPDIRFENGGFIDNKMELYHGGNLDEYNDIIAQKNGRYEWGAGLYLTTHQDTARKYAKGSRKLYKITVKKGVNIQDATIELENIKAFIKKYVTSSKRKEVLDRISKYDNSGKIKAFIFNNVILNEKAITASNTKNLRTFLVENGIDYDIVDNPFGWGETMIVLYNMDKIVNVEKLDKSVYEDGGALPAIQKKSNLTDEQAKLVRTKEFKEWFGDWENDPKNASKVVDENGEPLVVYHGTYSEFTSFKLGYGKYSSFTQNKKLATSYGNKVSDYFLQIKNPYIIEGNGEYIWKFIGESDSPESFFAGKVPFEYDAIVFKNVIDFSGRLGSEYVLDVSDVYMVRKNTQIKLADGSNTTFDSNNPDIRFEQGGNVAANGKQSNLTAEQSNLVRTKEFKEWFGDWENDPENASKVVDENGEPLVMYRGNIMPQEELGFEFKLGHNFLEKQYVNNFGFFFTNRIDKAKLYMEVNHWDEVIGGSMVSVFLKSNRILDLRDFGLRIGKPDFINGLIEKGISFEGYEDLKDKIINFSEKNVYYGWNEWVYEYFDIVPELKYLFIYNGYTSVLFRENSRSTNESYNVYVVFDSTQIKLANGSNTTFDSNNPDIRFADGGQVKKGLKAELEHIDTLNQVYKHKLTPKQAIRGIVNDHLSEDSKYYDKLAVMENKTSKNSSQLFEEGGEVKLNTYKQRVAANLEHMATKVEEWSAVPIIGFAHTDVNGIIKTMPEFSFPTGYAKAPTLFLNSEGDNMNCELCGRTPIKNAFYIQNDSKKFTLLVGSECVKHFGDGASGKENLRQFKLNQAEILNNDLVKALFYIKENYSKVKTESLWNGGKRTHREWTQTYVTEGYDQFHKSSLSEIFKEGKLDVLFKKKSNSTDNIKWYEVAEMIKPFDIAYYEKFRQDDKDAQLLSWYKRNKESSEAILKALTLIAITTSGDILEFVTLQDAEDSKESDTLNLEVLKHKLKQLLLIFNNVEDKSETETKPVEIKVEKPKTFYDFISYNRLNEISDSLKSKTLKELEVILKDSNDKFDTKVRMGVKDANLKQSVWDLNDLVQAHYSANNFNDNIWSSNEINLLNLLKQDNDKGVLYNKVKLENLAKSYGITDKNHVKEIAELSICLNARDYAHDTTLSKEERYNKIVKLYERQVNLSHRTSQSIIFQQYSTPAPIGYVAGVYCGFDNDEGQYFEPSAGNGLLTIAGNPKNFIVNEIDKTRRKNLSIQGFKKINALDASKPFLMFEKNFDGIITNPPFGKADVITFDKSPIKSLEQIMAINGLKTMKDNGRAAIIIGGHTEYKDGLITSGKNRIFFFYLYKNYNVEDVINISGRDLYSRQGTSFNVRLILINGRKEIPSGTPLVMETFEPMTETNSPIPVNDFNVLWQRINKLL